jgi:hypothetical protein
MRFAPLLLALFVSTALAGPAAPPLDVRGAEKPVPADDFVELWAEPPAQKPAGWVGVTYEWQVFSGLSPRRFRTFSEDGREGIYFVPPKNGGKLLVTATASHLFLDGTKASVRTAKAYAVVTIEGGKVDPPLRPGGPANGTRRPPRAFSPPVHPGRKVQGGQGGLRQRHEGPRPGPVQGVGPRGRLQDTAKKIQGGQLKGVKAILDDSRARSKAALGSDEGAWEAWGDWLQNKLVALFEGDSIKSDADFATVLEEIAVGLGSVR